MPVDNIVSLCEKKEQDITRAKPLKVGALAAVSWSFDHKVVCVAAPNSGYEILGFKRRSTAQ